MYMYYCKRGSITCNICHCPFPVSPLDMSSTSTYFGLSNTPPHLHAISPIFPHPPHLKDVHVQPTISRGVIFRDHRLEVSWAGLPFPFKTIFVNTVLEAAKSAIKRTVPRQCYYFCNKGRRQCEVRMYMYV